MRTAKSLFTLGLGSLLLAAAAKAGDQFYVYDGVAPNIELGAAIGARGDIDGDGVQDFVIGAPDPQSTHGKTIAYSGRSGAQIWSWSFAKYSGSSVSCSGDVDHDGYADVVTSGDHVVRVLSGKPGSPLWIATGPGDFAGTFDHVLILGDIDYDDCADVVVASPKETVMGAIETGVVRLYSGKTGAVIETIWGGGLNQHFGTTLAYGGDINNDGRPDCLVSSTDFNGSPAVSAIYGTWNQVGMTVKGDLSATPYYGHGLAGGLDLDNDGYDDFIVGDPAYSSVSGANNGAGRYQIYSGKTKQILLAFSGSAGDNLGLACALVPDVNADGRADYAVSAPGRVSFAADGTHYGRVTLHSSANGSIVKSFLGSTTNSNSFGSYLEGCSVNFDGIGDLMIADPFETTPGGLTGRVTVNSGTGYTSSWDNYGVGLGGALGVPTFAFDHAPTMCDPATLTIGNSYGSAIPGVLLVGFAPVSLPTGYLGTVVVSPFAVYPLPIPAAGLVMPVTICDSLAIGINVYAQVAEIDPSAPRGVSFSRGLHFQFGL